MRKKILSGFLGVILLSSCVLASGVNIYFKQNGIKNETGGTLSDANYHNYQARLEFFHNTGPAPTENPPKYDPAYVTSQYTLTSDNYNKYQLSATDGGNMYIRIWKDPPGTPADNRGNYYGKTSTGVSAGTVTAVEKRIEEISTDYHAVAPINAPTWGRVSESNVRIGDSPNANLSLSTNFTYSLGNPKIETQGFLLKFWKDGETDPGDAATAPDGARVFLVAAPASEGGSQSFSLPAVDALSATGAPFSSGTYHFKVRAYNWYGSGPWSSELVWPTLGGGMIGAVSVPYSLKKAEGGLGLNAIAALHSIPFKVESTAGIDTVGKLIAAINTKSGTNNVTTFGWMEDGSANLQGWYITYDASGTATYTPTGGLTTGPDTPLVINRIYQISVLQNVDVTFSQ